MRTISRYNTQFAAQQRTNQRFIPFGEWMPDMPALSNPGANVATNVIPRTDKSYGPFPSATVFSSALTAYCRGAYSGRDTTGNVANFAGDGTALYKSNGNGWDDVTNTGGAYTTGSAQYWEFAQYGDVVIATNLADNPQAFTVSSDTNFADLDSNAPKGKTVETIKDFLMFGDTNDGTDGDQPNRVWWSAIGDPTSWPTPGTASAAQVQSDYQNLPGTGRVQKIVAAVGGSDGAVFCERGIWRMNYSGPPYVFTFDLVEGARGTRAPRSVINIGPVAFYIGEDLGFYMFNGATSVPIGVDKVDKYFASIVDQNSLHRVTSAASPKDKLVMWSFQQQDVTDPDRILVYNWHLQRFSLVQLDHELLRRATADGYTLEQLDNIDSNIETFPYSFDDPILQGGATLLSIFDTSHRAANLDGDNLAAEIETTEVDLVGNRVYADGIRPIVDNEDEVTAAFKYRDSQETDPTAQTYTSRDTEGICYNQIAARYLRASVKIASGASWNHAQGVQVPYVPDGER